MWLSFLIFIFTVFSTVASNPSFEGIKLPEIRQINGVELHKNGHGLRSIHFFGMEVKVYVAVFYSQKPLLNGEDVLACDDSPMILDFTFLRNVSKNRVISAWRQQIDYSSSFGYEEFEKDKDAFIEMLTSPISNGGTQTIQIVDDDTIFIDQGVQKGIIRGRNFQKLFLSIFFGEHAVTEDLKSGLLSGHSYPELSLSQKQSYVQLDKSSNPIKLITS